MSDIIVPIQSDASGLVTFQRIETVEVIEPSPRPGPSRGRSAGARDGVLFSQPIKKHLETKKSQFAVQLPPPAPPPPAIHTPVLSDKSAVQDGPARPRWEPARPEESYSEKIRRAQAEFRQRLAEQQEIEARSRLYSETLRPLNRPEDKAAEPIRLRPGSLFNRIA